MELRRFIYETLLQIAGGVNDAKGEFEKAGGEINPKNFRQVEGGIPYGKETPIHSDAKYITDVKFEVVLTNDVKEGSSAGIGVLLGYMNVGGKKEMVNDKQSLTKVSFNIPVKLP